METIDHIIAEIPNCSRITGRDKPLYEEFFKIDRKKNPYHYCRNWIFIEQISSGYGIKYFDKKREHLITIAPDWGRTVPNYVYLPLGRGSIESVPFVVKELARILGQKITVKKIYGKRNRNYLLRHGITEVPTTGNIDFENLDDDKYPEIICDVDCIIKATYGFPIEGISMGHFRSQIKKIMRRIVFGEYNLREEKLTAALEEPFRELVDRWSSDISERMAEQFKKGANPEKIKEWVAEVYYPYFIKAYPDKVDNQNFIAYLTFINDSPAAFTSAYSVSDICLAVNANFCDTGYSGLGRFQLYRLAVRAKILGYKYLNLGSNDVESQHRFCCSVGKIVEVYPYILQYQI